MREVALQLGERDVTIEICDSCAAAFFDFADGTPTRLARLLRDDLPPERAVSAVKSRDDEPDGPVDPQDDPLAWLTDTDDSEPESHPPPAPTCAACRREMSAHPSLDGVFRCRGCCGVFARSAGLRRLAKIKLPGKLSVERSLANVIADAID